MKSIQSLKVYQQDSSYKDYVLFQCLNVSFKYSLELASFNCVESPQKPQQTSAWTAEDKEVIKVAHSKISDFQQKLISIRLQENVLGWF